MRLSSPNTTESTTAGARNTIGEGALIGMGYASVSRTVANCQSFITFELGAVVSLSELHEAVPEGALVLSVLMVL